MVKLSITTSGKAKPPVAKMAPPNLPNGSTCAERCAGNHETPFVIAQHGERNYFQEAQAKLSGEVTDDEVNEAFKTT